MMKINLPLTKEIAKTLKAGNLIKLSGVIYTARDAAHKRLIERLEANEPLPFDLKDSIIYYVGPTPEKPGAVIGSAGPTTSYRMDAYTPTLLDLGLRGMIGKGPRNSLVIDAMKRNDAVYFAAVGGAAALLALHIKEAEVIAFDDLGTEAIRRLVVEDFPVIVATDCHGNSLYSTQN
ncbi:Fe-S-containing hydro-lyase [Turicibacter sp. TJ11]|uniref:Fe-S-containing hydro-lyase n=1 Tax=Turicibacter sp. TJ11 TaxID=2806443 RepID=UPI001F1EEE51|nr:Fe-S-containing hydro-lyase [Turicibacter sp. TJ11]